MYDLVLLHTMIDDVLLLYLQKNNNTYTQYEELIDTVQHSSLFSLAQKQTSEDFFDINHLPYKTIINRF